jgi:hypothetical protein
MMPIAMGVECTDCGAAVGVMCSFAEGGVHSARIEAALFLDVGPLLLPINDEEETTLP